MGKETGRDRWEREREKKGRKTKKRRKIVKLPIGRDT